MNKAYELDQYLKRVLDEMVENQNLCKLLYYNSDNPLDEADLVNPKNLIKDKIIPRPFIPDITKEASSFAIITIDNIKGKGRTLHDGIVYFDIFCHDSLWYIKDGLRPFALFGEIQEIFCDKYIKGIGKFTFAGCKLISSSNEYKGYRVSYEFTNFNKQ